VPLGKHQDVASPQCFDRLLQLRTPHALPARQLLFENSPATLDLEHCELPIEVLMGRRYARIADEHWVPRFSMQKLGTEKRYTQVVDYTSTSCVYRILRQTVQLKVCSRLPRRADACRRGDRELHQRAAKAVSPAITIMPATTSRSATRSN